VGWSQGRGFRDGSARRATNGLEWKLLRIGRQGKGDETKPILRRESSQIPWSRGAMGRNGRAKKRTEKIDPECESTSKGELDRKGQVLNFHDKRLSIYRFSLYSLFLV
jgi:hypothetical protein